jgi:hypothetical protein
MTLRSFVYCLVFALFIMQAASLWALDVWQVMDAKFVPLLFAAFLVFTILGVGKLIAEKDRRIKELTGALGEATSAKDIQSLKDQVAVLRSDVKQLREEGARRAVIVIPKTCKRCER